MMVLVVFTVFPEFWEILHNPNTQLTSLPAVFSDTIVTNHQGTAALGGAQGRRCNRVRGTPRVHWL